MKTPNSKLILGAVVVGIITYGSLVFYEKNKIAEIQAAGPEDKIVPPSKAVLFCVNHKLGLSIGIVAVLLTLASYGSSKGSSVVSASSPPEEPPAAM